MANLMRLKIPKGWVILDNKFHDTEPELDLETGLIKNWNEGFTEDALWIQEYSLSNDGKFKMSEYNYYNIDISWISQENTIGEYFAKLSWISLDEMIEVESLSSQNRFEIRNIIEQWMENISENFKEMHNKYL